jgi:Histone chaperone Rttp106-like
MEEALRTKDVKSLVQLMKACTRSSGSDETSQNTTDEQNLLALKAILTSSVAEIGRLITQASKEEALKGGSGGEAYTVIADAQLIEPRGRFTVSLSSEGMLLDGKSTTCFVPWEKISHCACLPSNLSTKKEGEELLAFLLAEPVKYCNKEIKTLLWSLGKSRAKLTHALLPGSLTPMDGTEHEVVATLVAALCKKKIATPRKELFQSVTMQRPYLKCYRGIQEGALYPLKNGLIFLKPLLFIPTESIASLTAGRGGSGNTRYIDLMVRNIFITLNSIVFMCI